MVKVVPPPSTLFTLIVQVLVDEDESAPGAAIAIQTFCDFLAFNPHTHVPIPDGCFYGE